MFLPPSHHRLWSSMRRICALRPGPATSPPPSGWASVSSIDLPRTLGRTLRPSGVWHHALQTGPLRAVCLQPGLRRDTSSAASLPAQARALRPACSQRGTRDAKALVEAARSVARLSPKHPDRRWVFKRLDALLDAPDPACRMAALAVIEAVGIDQAMPAVLRCAADAHEPLRRQVRQLLIGSSRAYSRAQAMLADPENFEIQYAGLRLLHQLVPVTEASDSPRVRLLHDHLAAWQRRGALHYVQAARMIALQRRVNYIGANASSP